MLTLCRLAKPPSCLPLHHITGVKRGPVFLKPSLLLKH